MPPSIAAPIRESRINQSIFVGEMGVRTIQRAVTLAVAEGGGFCIVIPAGYAGADTIAAVTGGSASVYLCDQRTEKWRWYVWGGTSYVPADFHVGNNLTVDGDSILTGGVTTGNVNAGGFLDVAGPANTHGLLQAFGSFFSPVLTVGESNTIAGKKAMQIDGYQLEIQGFLVGGTNDQEIKINPQGGTVQLGKNATMDENGNLVSAGGITTENVNLNGYLDVLGPTNVHGAMQAFSTLALSLDPTLPGQAATKRYVDTAIAESGNFVYPGKGITVSTGAAWDTPIDPATLAKFPPTGIPQSTGTAWAASINPATLATYPGAGIGVSTGTAWGTPIDPATVPLLDGANNLALPGKLTLAGPLTVPGLADGNTSNLFPAYSISMFRSAGSYNQVIRSTGDSGNGGVVLIQTDAAAGAGVINIATFQAGGMNVTGTINASGAKNFLIPHPLDPTKNLTHSCVEGPEVAVFYRGEVKCVGGKAEVTLPDYFEALTLPTGRTVQLTQVGDDSAQFANLMASRVSGGKFKIRSSVADATVCWEVKAVRGDVSIEVVSERTTPEPPAGAAPEPDSKGKAKKVK